MPRTDSDLANVLIFENDSDGKITMGTVNGTPPTTADKFAIGCILTDSVTGTVYRNIGTVASPSWEDSKADTNAELGESALQFATVEISADEIVGTDVGDLGHANGVELVAAPGAGKVLEFVSAVLSYSFDTAAYTGGGDDLVVRQGTTSVSAAIAAADLLGDTADDIAYVNALSAADIKLTANSNLNLKSTAWTDPGTAAGTLKVFITYRVHTL